MKVRCQSNDQTYLEPADTNPCLYIDNIPEITKSLVLVAVNPETRKIHWVVYNIPVTNIIDEHFKKGVEAVNDFSVHGFIGPEQTEHGSRLFFIVYALDEMLVVGGGKGGHDIIIAMKGHIIDTVGVECHYECTASVLGK